MARSDGKADAPGLPRFGLAWMQEHIAQQRGHEPVIATATASLVTEQVVVITCECTCGGDDCRWEQRVKRHEWVMRLSGEASALRNGTMG